MRLKNIEFLIDGNGQITLGQIGPIHCAAVAHGEGRSLAMLVKRPRESLSQFLGRLDSAIEDAMDREIYADEING